MANPYINIYMNNPTIGEQDGSPISFDDSFSNPLFLDLDASVNESKIVKLGIRTEPGYVTVGTTTLEAVNANNKILLSISADGPFNTTLGLNDTISSSNMIFYAKISSSNDEVPGYDKTGKIKITTIIDEENNDG